MTDKHKSNMILMNLLLVAAALLLVNTSSVNGQQNNRSTTVGSGLGQCGKVGDTNTAFMQIQRGDDESGGTYTVSYTFDWGPTAYNTFAEIPYGVKTTVNSTNVYNTPGVYNVGYTVEFCKKMDSRQCGDSGGDDTFSMTTLLKIEDDSCVWGYTTPSPSATVEPTTSAPTYAMSPTTIFSSSGLLLYSLFPALTMSGILTIVLS
jgi:hypothetical protein